MAPLRHYFHKDIICAYVRAGSEIGYPQNLHRRRHAYISVQFPSDQPFPMELIRRVIAYRVREEENTLPFIGRPAASALAEVGVTTVSDLAGWTEKELLALHGVGPKAIRLLREASIPLA